MIVEVEVPESQKDDVEAIGKALIEKLEEMQISKNIEEEKKKGDKQLITFLEPFQMLSKTV